MAKIEWNRVTWYSKLVALALFIALPFIGFWFGMQYGEVVAPLNGSSVIPQIASGTAMGIAGNDYYANVAEWQTESNFPKYISIAYPIGFQVDDNAMSSPGWRMNSSEADTGMLFFTLTIPRAFEPQTNFDDAKLTVGSSLSGGAVRNCLLPDQTGGPAEATSTATVDGVVFTVFHSSDAGAGNLYQTTSYRTIYAGACYAVEYTIHSSQIANYPPEYNLKPFDPNKLTDVLDRIVGTFKFL
jgi:hypothetical protein